MFNFGGARSERDLNCQSAIVQSGNVMAAPKKRIDFMAAGEQGSDNWSCQNPTSSCNVKGGYINLGV